MSRVIKFEYIVIKGSGHVLKETFPLGDIENGRVITWLKMNHASDDTCEIYSRQFTGLHDNNGKEIYEGDIIAWVTTFNDVEPKKKHIDVMTWDTEYGCYFLMPWVHEVNGAEMTIIGNIHENPDLLNNERS